MAIRKAKCTVTQNESDCNEQGFQEEQENMDTSKSFDATDEEISFLAGFGSFHGEDHNESATTNSEVNISETEKEGCSKDNKDVQDIDEVSCARGTSTKI